MGSINRSHNEADGGVLLFNGELILLYCDSVNCEIGGRESFKGRVYLTTHRLVVIVAPYKQTASIKSLCAPFCAIVKCNVEQPIFGANYIEATVRDETDSTKSFSFKLKFSKGGAIELAMAMNRAVATVGRFSNPSMPPPPSYTPTPSSQYYQAPPTVYAPGYNCGVPMPVQQFPDQPPIGFIYASSAPPPYPGLGTNGPAPQAPPSYNQPGAQGQPGGYPSGPQPTGPQPTGYGYPQANYPTNHPQQPTYPQQPGGYPSQEQQPDYPRQPPAGYPSQTQQADYPRQPPPAAGYPPNQPSSNYPAPAPQSDSGYPNLSSTDYPQQNQLPAGGPQPNAGSAWPSAPSYNPNWQEDKKSS